MPGKITVPAGWLALICLIWCCGCGKKVTLNSLVTEMSDRASLSYDPETPYRLRQVSSYNRASVSPDQVGWYANADMSHFISVEEHLGRREFVMFDEKGPGVIVRWWMTFYLAQKGVIRVYLDHSEVPVIEGRADQVLSGTLLTFPPFAVSVHQGVPIYVEGRDMDHNFYLPIPFAGHCIITYECDSLELTGEGNYFPDVFYNIGFRAYAEGTRMESFSIKALSKAKPLLEEAKKVLQEARPGSLDAKDFEQEIEPEAVFALDFERNGAAVDLLRLEVMATDTQQALRSTVISASFDGKTTLWAPVGDFFGTGYGIHPHQTWMNRTDEHGVMESFWVMPFQQKCQIAFTNYGDETITIKGRVGLSDYEWRPGSMFFGTAWHEYHRLWTRDSLGNFFDLNFIEIQGKGVYVGDQITLFNTSYQWWGEGDEKIFVDGESFPSSFGTGSEDYYGYAFGRREPFSHPFISQPVGDGNEGNTDRGGLTVNMRQRSLDAIPFTSSISSNIELWHWAPALINYALMSHWYVHEPFTVNITPDVNSVRFPVARSTADLEE